MEFFVNWLAAIPAYAAPLLLACLGLIINERAGVLNLGAEGMMACGALAGHAGLAGKVARSKRKTPIPRWIANRLTREENVCPEGLPAEVDPGNSVVVCWKNPYTTSG